MYAADVGIYVGKHLTLQRFSAEGAHYVQSTTLCCDTYCLTILVDRSIRLCTNDTSLHKVSFLYHTVVYLQLHGYYIYHHTNQLRL